MKKSDIATIILIASFSVLVSYLVVGSIPGLKPASESVNVKTIERYSADITDPDEEVFSSDAINPTVQVTIGETEQGTDGPSND